MLMNCAGAVYLSKISGGPVSEELARGILWGWGSIEELWHSSATEREINRLPEGK